MLDGDHWQTNQLVTQLTTNAQMKATFDLIECLKPTLTVIDNMQGGKCYCFDYKGIIVSGGDTVFAAMMDFDRKFYNQKADLTNG